MKFRKKPVEIEATQWFKAGDSVVQPFRHSAIPGSRVCKQCQNMLEDHGWIDTLEGGHIVCVGDWVITGVEGEHYPCKPAIFEKTYERAD